jgi:hypothetical protein
MKTKRYVLPDVRRQIEARRSLGVDCVVVYTPTGEAVVDIKAFDRGGDLPASCYFGGAQRPAVYDAIDQERNHQIEKYGADKQQSIPGFLLIIENELNEAKAGWTKNLEGRHSAMHEICQIAATCVAAMEKYGTSGSAISTDDIPVPTSDNS